MKKTILFPIAVLIAIVCFSTGLTTATAQQNFRFKADFSIKEKKVDGKDQLIIGTVYFDNTQNRTVYDVSFPEKQVWVIEDTLMSTYQDGALLKTKTIPNISEYSLFGLLLSGKLNDYGLKDSPMFKVGDIEKSSDMLITTYEPLEKYAEAFGKVMLSQKNKKINGLIVFNPEGKQLSKQLFKNYVMVAGLNIPQELLQILYVDGEEFYKITTFKNVLINDMSSDIMYDYSGGE